MIGFYAGSFDPFTNGHLEVVKKASKIFDEVIIGIGNNPTKLRRYDQVAMHSIIEEILNKEQLENVKVLVFTGLGVDAAKNCNCDILIRGIRNNVDYNYEENIASINEEVSGLDTIYIRSGSLGNVSSSMVMELVRNGKDISKYVPEPVLKYIYDNIYYTSII